MAQKNIDVAMESTSQEILMKVVGLISAGNEITCTASDNVLLTPVSSEITGKVVPLCEYKVNQMSGTLRVNASLCRLHDGYPAVLDTLVNGSKVAEMAVGTNISGYKTFTKDITVVSGDVIRFNLHSSFADYGGKINLLTICGDFSEPTSPVPGLSRL